MALLKRSNIKNVVTNTFIEIKDFDKYDLKEGYVVILDDATITFVIPPKIASRLINNANEPMEAISFFYFPEGKNTERFSWIRCSDYKDTFPFRVNDKSNNKITQIFYSNIDLSQIKGNRDLRDLFYALKLNESAHKFIETWG